MHSHAEVRAMQRRNGLRWSAHFDMCCGLAPKNVEEEFAWRTAESSHRRARSKRHALAGSGPLDLEPGRAKPPTEVMAAAAHVSPQRSIHCRREATGPSSVGSANILVMNKELVEIGQFTDPPDAEEPRGRAGPDPCEEPREVLGLCQSGPTPLGEPLEGTRKNEARTSNQIAFPQHDVGGEIVSSPTLEQSGNGRAELVEEITERKALLHVERNVSHGAEVYGDCGGSSVNWLMRSAPTSSRAAPTRR